jgi:hypothetical protein
VLAGAVLVAAAPVSAVPGETPAKAAAKFASSSEARAGRRTDEARILGFLRKLRASGESQWKAVSSVFSAVLLRPAAARKLR